MLQRLRAFTLIELALVLVIVSLMTGFGLQAFETTASVNCNANTQDQLKTIDRALQNFAASQSRFPKPALMGQGSSNPQFGYEAVNGATLPTDAAYATNVPSGMINTGGVLIGALPHATLGLPAEYATDCWGSKFTYAVTNSQTSSEENVGYRSAVLGNIALRTGTLSSNQEVSPLITYVVVSHGEDKFGATPMSAGDPVVKHCNASTANKTDRENCNSDATFYSSMMNTGGTGNFFDDLLVYSAKVQSKEDCADQTFTWNTNCSTMSGVILHGNSATISGTGSYSGSVTVTCKDSKLTASPGATCVPTAPCAGGTITWSAAGSAAGPCSATVTGRDHNYTYTGLNNSASGYTGNVTVRCDNGSWVGYTTPSCAATKCPAMPSMTWGPGNICSASIPSEMNDGDSTVVVNATPGYSGQTTFVCNAGTWSGPSGTTTCDSATNPCYGSYVSWGSVCGVTVGNMNHGDTPQPITNTSGAGTGSAVLSCNNGTFSTSSQVCNRHCMTGGTATWNTNCSASRPNINHGSSASVSNTASGYTGAATISCTNGTYSAPSGTTCDVIMLPDGTLFCWGQNSFGQLGNNTTTGRPAPSRVTDPVGVTSWLSVTTAYQSSCGIGNNGQAYCWGAAGLVGDGTSTARLVPTSVVNPSGVSSWNNVNATYTHSCGVGNNGQAYCWGSNMTRQIGDNTTTSRTAPTLVTNPSGVTSWSSVTAGTFHSCGIGNNGRAYCWGQSSFGELGTGGGSVGVPTIVTNPSGVTNWNSVYATSSYSCGIGNNGQAYCWGYNSDGQIGDNTTNNRAAPTPITNPSGVTGWNSIAVGTTSNCAIGNNGQAYCWGNNSNGQIGDNTTISRPVPTLVINPSGVTSWHSLSVRQAYSCGIGNNAQTYCWGANYNRTPTLVSTPAGITGWSSVSIADNHRCAISGAPVTGVCGTANGTNNNLSAPSTNLCASGTPSAVTGTGPYVWNCVGAANTANCSANRSCAAGTATWMTNCSKTMPLTQSGSAGGPHSNTAAGYTGSASMIGCNQGAWTFPGTNTCTASVVSGACGSANGGNYATAPSSSLCSAGTQTSVSGSLGTAWTWDCTGSGGGGTANCSANRSCAAATLTWNTNCSFSQSLQNSGYSASVTNTASGYSGSATVTCTQGNWGSSSSSCAALTPSNAYCWGNNGYGQLGTGPTYLNATTPQNVNGNIQFTTIEASMGQSGGTHVCARSTVGAAYCWGSGADYRLGNASLSNAPAPALVSGGLGFSQLSVGGAHTCGLTGTSIYCWGDNQYYQGGINTQTDSQTPTQVSGSWSAVDAGTSHTCALNTSGAAYCWGGNGSTYYFHGNTPTAVPGGLTFNKISAGHNYQCALTAAGAAYCWGGTNTFGQFGDGSTSTNATKNTTPQLVQGGLTFKDIHAGTGMTCAVTTGNSLYCWGNGYQWGGTGPTTTSAPELITTGVATVTKNNADFVICMVKDNGVCWKFNTDGMLGDGTTNTSWYPTWPSGGHSFSIMTNGYSSTSARYTCALRSGAGSAVSGVCGSAHGTSPGSIPYANLCSTGKASAASGSGPWTWTCAGVNGGSTANCSTTSGGAACTVPTNWQSIVGGTTLAHGASATGYTRNPVPYSVCIACFDYQVRITCNNGSLNTTGPTMTVPAYNSSTTLYSSCSYSGSGPSCY